MHTLTMILLAWLALNIAVAVLLTLRPVRARHGGFALDYEQRSKVVFLRCAGRGVRA